MKSHYKLLFKVAILTFKMTIAFAAQPTMPTSVVANAGNARVNIVWVASNGTGTIKYKVQRSEQPPVVAYVDIFTGLTSTSYSDTSVANNKAYFYQIVAYNAEGSSTSSEVKAIPNPPPSAPSFLAATTTADKKVALTWYPSTANGPLTYTVFRSLTATNGYGIIASGLTSLSYKDLSATLGTKYFYVIQAKNSIGTSISSNEVSITTGAVTPPASPTELVATVIGDNQVELSWKASLAGGDLTYELYRSRYSNFSSYDTIKKDLAVLNYIDTTVTKGIKYYYTVKALNSIKTISTYSKIANVFLSSANLLFKTSFGPGVILNPASSIIAPQAWQTITGRDLQTNYDFPVAGLGSNGTVLQLIGPYAKGGTALTSTNVNQFFENKIEPVKGPKGITVNQLKLNLKIKEEPVGVANSQVPLIIQRPHNKGDTGDVYISYWFKLPADLPNKLNAFVKDGNWRVFFEWKTGGYNNTYAGDYRMKTVILKGKDGSLYWSSGWDNLANMWTLDKNKDGTPWTPKTFWPLGADFSGRNHIVPVPLNKWFKFEVFWHRSYGSDGHYWVAIDGQKIADHYGPNIGDYGLPITRLMLNNSYTGGAGPVEGYMTDLQIWNGFPCGQGISCP